MDTIVCSPGPGTMVIRPGETALITNADLVNTLYLSDEPNIQIGQSSVIPLTPGSWVVVSRDEDEMPVFAGTATGQKATLYKIPGGMSFFLPVADLIASDIFLYNGQGAPGNPPLLSMTKPGVTADKFGNPVIADALTTYNAFGAVINCMSMAQGGFFQYQDLGSSTQGARILSITSRTSNDPVLGGSVFVGVNGINPAFGNSLGAVGSSISLSLVPFTATGNINVNAGSGAVSPSIYLLAPEQGQSGHLVVLMEGTSPDGTHLGQFVLAREPTGIGLPTPVTNALAEIQGVLAHVNASAPPGVATTAQQYASAGVLHHVTAAGLDGGIPAVQSDHTTFTVTGTGSNQASKQWAIPANDSNVDTTYSLEIWGHGTEGTTAQNLTFGIGLNGTAIRTVQATALPISAAFRFYVKIILHVVTTGTSGTCDVILSGHWSSTASPTVENSFSAGSQTAAGETINTTVQNLLDLTLGWAATTGAPTSTSHASRFERAAA